MPTDDATPTVVLYCHNDGCSHRSGRYEGEFPPSHCPECGSKYQKEPVRRETHIRGPRSYNEY